MSLEEARSFAECWVDKHKERIFEIIDKDFKFRDFFLRDLLVDDNQTAYAGLPAIYLTKCAQRDPATFDILVDLLNNTKQQPQPIEALRESIRCSHSFKSQRMAVESPTCEFAFLAARARSVENAASA